MITLSVALSEIYLKASVVQKKKRNVMIATSVLLMEVSIMLTIGMPGNKVLIL